MWNPVGATAPKRLANIYFCVYLPGTSYQELHLIWQQEGRSKALKCTTEFKYELTGMEAHTREQQPESQPEKAKVYMRRYPNMSLRRPAKGGKRQAECRCIPAGLRDVVCTEMFSHY